MRHIGPFATTREKRWTVRYSSDGRYLAFAGFATKTRLLVTHSWSVVAEFDTERQQIWALEFSPDSHYLATAGDDGTIVVLEDTTELLRAQRQMAWKEAAQRIAHEVKNPLTPIGLSAERMLRHLDKPTPETPGVLRKCSEVILSSVASLRSLFDHFAALAEFPALQPRPTAIQPIVERALAMFAGRMEGITLRVHLQPDLPPVLVDAAAIQRALANLIDNAAEAMQSSLLKVLTVSAALTADGSQIEIAISDTGNGLTEDMRERLFLPFYSTKQRGTGLGLSIAAKIAQDHRGSIRAESNSPQGARFLLCLPVAEVAAETATETSAAPSFSETEATSTASK